MIARWTAFARGEGPQAADVEVWAPFDTVTRATLVIDGTDRIVDDLDAELRTSWGETVLSFR